MPIANEILEEALIGRQLSAVTFVMDYFRFEFDGNNLIVYSLPIATFQQDPEGGFRDQLCAFIARDVTSVREIEGVAVHIDFGEFGRLSVPLDEDSQRTVEIAELLREGKTVLMW
ncbi:hypothetical protein KPL74_04545 [Bacillus sp. NP157]|nr:hypothetical protein KPL74_04545 [Bacillus sp. NP157]